MSSRLVIQQVTEKIHCTGDEYKAVHIFDDYGHVSLSLLDLNDSNKFFENDLELLETILKFVNNNSQEALDNLLSYHFSENMGIKIENTYYDFDEICHIIKKVEDEG